MKMRLVCVSTLGLFLVLALSGCLVISDVSSTQLDTVGNVRITLQACFSQTAGSCTNLGNSGEAAGFTAGGTQVHQPMIGFRFPSAAIAPDSITTTAGEALSFVKNGAYTQALQTLSPPPAGQQWVGYLATTAVTVTDGNNQTFTVRPEFLLRQGVDGSPFAGPFLYRSVVGARAVGTDPLTIDRPLDCGTSLFAGNSGGDTICVDSPSAADTAANMSQSTRDLGVLVDAAVVNVRPGQTATVPFTIKYAGSSTASANFAIDATTNITGATAIASQGSLLPAADSSNPVNVVVSIPKSAPSGTYDITLNARLANGQVRTTVRKLKIDKTAPTLQIKQLTKKTSAMLKSGLKLNVRISEAGSVTFVLAKTKKGASIAIATKATYGKAGAKNVTLKLKKGQRTGVARASMLTQRSLKLYVRMVAKDLLGNKRTVVKKIEIKR